MLQKIMVWRFDTLFKIPQSLSLPQSALRIKNREIWALIFLNCESSCDLTNVRASIYERKIDARPFDTTHDVLRCLSFVQSLFKDRNERIWRIGNRRVNTKPWNFDVKAEVSEPATAELRLISGVGAYLGAYGFTSYIPTPTTFVVSFVALASFLQLLRFLRPRKLWD